MNAHRSNKVRLLPWFLPGLYVLLMGAGMALEALTGSTVVGIAFPIHMLAAAVFFVWALVGALLASRHPEHPVGWIFLSVPIFNAIDHVTYGYAYYGTIFYPGSLPGAEFLIFWHYSNGAPTLLLLVLLFLLFPTGRPPSRRWRLVVPAAVSIVTIYMALATLAPERMSTVAFPFPTNPFGLSESTYALLDMPRRFFYALSFLMPAVAIFSLFYRLHRSRGVERQQIKWLAYAAALFAPGAILVFLGELGEVLGIATDWLQPIGVALGILSITGIAIASAIAILRYRLYDIDIIIRRTLQYGILTGILALIYLGLVVVFQALFAAIGDLQSDVFIVISTLAIAALFNPLRKRVQEAIDRRFYRKNYDAERALVQFAAAARDEVDLNKLTAALLDIINDTMQPSTISVWLRHDAGNSRATGSL